MGFPSGHSLLGKYIFMLGMSDFNFQNVASRVATAYSGNIFMLGDTPDFNFQTNLSNVITEFLENKHPGRKFMDNSS